MADEAGSLLAFQVQELAVDYSDCITKSPLISEDDTGSGLADIPSSKITKSFRKGDYSGKKAPQWGHFNTSVTYNEGSYFKDIVIPSTNVCRLQFDIEHNLTAPVYMYYRLSNFYQNHRRYVKSYDQSQMDGNVRDGGTLKGGDCAPLDVDSEGKPYYPCGLIANSIFNDTLQSPFLLNPPGGGNASEYTMSSTGIAWNSDKDLYKKTKYTPDQVVPPPNWRKKFPSYNESNFPDISEFEQLFVWMRTAGLPTFSKLALRKDSGDMQQGRYQVEIWDGETTLRKIDVRLANKYQNSIPPSTAAPRKCFSPREQSWVARIRSSELLTS
jgi:hypothetical protein